MSPWRRENGMGVAVMVDDVSFNQSWTEIIIPVMSEVFRRFYRLLCFGDNFMIDWRLLLVGTENKTLLWLEWTKETIRFDPDSQV